MKEASGAQRECRVALAHDFLVDVRGADRVFWQICQAWPEADLLVPIYDERGTEGRWASRNIETSFLQRLRPSARTFRSLLPLYPLAIERFDVHSYDLVISSSSAWAHGVICDQGTVHVCYCHNPFRYAWNDRERTLASYRNPVLRAMLRKVFHEWRKWDWIAAQRVDRYVANSEVTRERIRRYFGRESTVVYPPVEVDRFAPGAVGEHYVVLSELMRHKRIDVAVEAFNQLGLPLVVVGDGPDLRRLRHLARPNVRFTGRASDLEVERLLQSARALILTATEEFGIAAVEAQAAGRPVIAVREGGVLETVVEGSTGAFFWPCAPDALARAVRETDDSAFSVDEITMNAARFGPEIFEARLREAVFDALDQSAGAVGSAR